MGLYKLQMESEDISTATLEKAKADTIDYEKDFENWLENSPHVLLDEDDESSILWIGRQTAATVEDSIKYPDLLGIDASGNLIIVELKKGRTPREVLAQLLEYATWGSALTYSDLNDIACSYFKKKSANFNKSLSQICHEEFFPDSEGELKVEFNKNQKLFVVAEEISPVIRKVASHLRTKYKLNIHCMEYEVLKLQQGEYLVSTEKIVGYDGIEAGKSPSASLVRWNQPLKVKDVVSDTVTRFTKGENSTTFSQAEIYKELIKEFPDINKTTVGCQIVQDCVNHSSRKHYPNGQRDLYFRVEKGKYRLYNTSNDGKWDWKGEKIF